MQEGGDWWHTYLVPASITVVMFPLSLSIKCIWFPAEGVAGRAEIWQQSQGQEGSSCKHHFHWCAWKRTKSGNAYTIRRETLSDLIFERGSGRSPQRVLLIHCPGPLWGDIGGLYNGGWQNDMLREAWSAFALITKNEFSHQSQESYLKSECQRGRHLSRKGKAFLHIRWQELVIGTLTLALSQFIRPQIKWLIFNPRQ